jgi:galactonate dehydratase
MKITRITPWLIGLPIPYLDAPEQRPRDAEFVFVQVETDEGITGWGEFTESTPTANRAAAAMLGQIGELIEGDDPARIELIWHKIFREYTYMGSRGAGSSVASGIDIALWDIRGQQLGLPICELLGGPVRESIALYTHPDGSFDPANIAAACKGILEQGFTAVKTGPFRNYCPDGVQAYLSGQVDAETEELGVEMIAAMREAVGPTTEILIDAHGRFDVPTAVRLANRLEPYTIGWFEEPLPPESLHALRQVRDRTNVPICVGERLHTRFDFLPILENELADFIMPDVTWTGGISELKRTATMAETYHIPVSPHDAGGPVNIAAGAHVMATVPNFYKLEIARGRLALYHHMMDQPFDIRDGHLHLSNRPGLGIEMNVDLLREQVIGAFSG